MKFISLKSAVILGSLIVTGAASVRAEEPAAIYALGQARWSAAESPKAVALLTPENLAVIKAAYGPGAARTLAEKKDRVSGLLVRYAVCELNAADAAAGVKYLRDDFSREISYLAGGGCQKIKAAAATGAPRSASLEKISSLAQAGSCSQSASARLFDGAMDQGSVSAPAAQGVSYDAAKPAGFMTPVFPHAAKPLSSSVPALNHQADKSVKPASDYPAELGRDGRVNQAVAYWDDMRRENWKAYSEGELHGYKKAKAFAKAAVGAGLGGLLKVSNLPRVETAAERLGWDTGHGAGAGVIAADSSKLAFNSGVFVFALLPISILDVSTAALAGEIWAVTYLGIMAAVAANRYLLHLDDD
ncbi:MAG: hypothetical protein NTX59_00500 [Elusimicrobia bacterium]|nr:hypothetical protein [Elusimicrobiota bacterium]